MNTNKTKRPPWEPPKQPVFKFELDTLSKSELLALYNEVGTKLSELNSNEDSESENDNHCNFDWTR
jgi:hypothetical protein